MPHKALPPLIRDRRDVCNVIRSNIILFLLKFVIIVENILNYPGFSLFEYTLYKFDAENLIIHQVPIHLEYISTDQSQNTQLHDNIFVSCPNSRI